MGQDHNPETCTDAGCDSCYRSQLRSFRPIDHTPQGESNRSKSVNFTGLNKERRNLHYQQSEAKLNGTRIEPYRPGNQIG